MNAPTLAYQASSRTDGGGLSRAVRRAEQDPSLHNNGHRCTLTRPLFVDKREIDGFASDLSRLLALLTSLPERVFDGDLKRFFDVLGVEPSRAAEMSRLGGQPPQLVGRADVYHDGTGFRLLEFGIGSELGGWTYAGDLPRTLLRDDDFAAFAVEHGLSFVDTGLELANALREASDAAGLGREPVVALVEAPGALEMWGNTWRLLQDGLRRLGIDFHVGDLSDISERGGKLHLGDVPVDVVYRTFEAVDVCHDPEAVALVDLVYRAHQDGRVVLWTSMEANLYGEKGCLAVLSDPRWGSAFSSEERDLIDRVLPWTRSLTQDTPEATQELVEQCRDRRTELILKPNSMYGGIGVVAGWEVDGLEWWDALKAGVANGAVVQERVTARPDVVIDPETGTEVDWRTLWGMFYTPDGYAGSRCWMVQDSGPAVIGLRHGKEVLAAGIFQVS